MQEWLILYAEWHGTTLTYQNRPCLVCIIRDVTFRIQEELLLREHVETRTIKQATLLKISHTLASTFALQPVMTLDQLHEIIEYNCGNYSACATQPLSSCYCAGHPYCLAR
jgi:hypothetical protein